MRTKAGELLGGRTGDCGKKPTGAMIQVRKADGKAFYNGLETCGSIWRCPVCHTKISEGRRADLDFITSAHLDRPGRVFLATFTTPHFAFDDLKKLRTGIATAYRRVLSGAPWQRAKDAYGIVGMIRSLEVTFGENGWHPHLHVLMLIDAEVSVTGLSEWLFERWAVKIEALGMGTCHRAAWTFDEARNAAATRDYVAKWSTSAELVGGIHKRGRGGRTPWQLLFDAGQGDIGAAATFMVYARAMEGAKQLTWSRGLREQYGMRDELSDDYLAAKEPEVAEVIGLIDRRLWNRLWKGGLAAQVLDLAEEKGWNDVLAWATNETGSDWI